MKTTSTRPKVGRLILLEGNQKRVLIKDKPFALLQTLKKGYILNGIKKENLKITY
jgi:hypothetical protein